MEYYFAPMEGITGYIYRNAHAYYYPGIKKYFSPFLAPNQNRCMNNKELKDILPENNQGLFLVPQILTNQAKIFLETQKQLEEYGYKEVNLNLGCPSRTVVTKKKGAGFLDYPEQLNRFLAEIFEKNTGKVSIKTRLGLEDIEEWEPLLEIYNQYPISELIIHPRLQTDYYKNKPNWEMFKLAVEKSRHSLIYNGDIVTIEDKNALQKEFPKLETIMIGRGFLKNPSFLIGKEESKENKRKRLKSFHDEIYEANCSILSGDKNILFRMKELWSYLIYCFEDSEKCAKQIKKAQKLLDYEMAIFALFTEKTLKN